MERDSLDIIYLGFSEDETTYFGSEGGVDVVRYFLTDRTLKVKIGYN